MRAVREVSAEEEKFRTERIGGFDVIRRDPVEPEPVGTIILVPMRVVGYDRDCDGSLMARWEQLGLDELEDTEIDPEILACKTPGEVERYAGYSAFHGLYPSTGIVATPDEILSLLSHHKD